MLILKVDQLTDDEIDALGTLAVEFDTATIADTVSRCVNFALECVEKAYETADDRQKLLGYDYDYDDNTE